MILSAVVTNGKAHFDPQDEVKLRSFMQQHENKRLWFVIDERRPARTLSQNSYYWKWVVETISDYTGDDPESTHATLKELFCPRFFDEQGRELQKTTTRLTTKEFKVYLDRIIAWAASEYSISIPDAKNA